MSEPDAIEDAKLLQRAIACFEQFADLDPDARRQHLHDLHSREPALAARVAKLLAADAREHGVLEAGLAALAPAALHQLASGRMEKEAHSANDMIGPWRLKEMLGRGGMGEVWLASRNDGQFEQQVAVKLLKRGMDSDGVLHRFQRERQILARLEHPGIARLLDGGMTAAGLPYFAMECIRGVPIDQFARTHQLDVRSRVRLVIALCSAVDYAHRHLVVHRDLKPANTLVTDEGVLKVLDFGIARVLDESSNVGATETGSRVMSPAYASPEQLLGEPIAIATDVYAIGLLLYELLSGVLPHGRGHQSLSQVVADVSRDATEAPSTLGRMWHRGAEAQGQVLPGIDRELDLIVLQALRSSPEARYPSAAALAEDLCSWLERRPIRARPATLGYRVAKFVARNRLAVVLGGVALAVVLAALSVSIVQRRAAIANAEAARASARRAELSKQFLVSMFDRADAFSTANHGEKTVVELLESTPDRLINELADEPEVQAELLLEIGSGLRVAGRRNSAHAAYRTALDSIARIPAADPILHAKALLYIGYAENDLGKSDDARTHLMQAQAIYRAAADDRRRELISVATGLARNANMRGDLTSALQLREQILSERRALSGERDPDYAMDLMNLSTSLIALGRYADAEQALRRSQALLSELLGARHLRTLTVLHALAAIHLEQGRLDEARTNAELVLERSADNAAAQASLRPAANSVLARVALYEYRLD
ncbi:MAG TPA: serine/threonine-protein kinase, partial [Dokdonella sp.]|nr:serine/threonine-protein kinase [Dokdonella sp.]